MPRTINTKNKGSCYALEPDDMQAISAMAITALERHKGRQGVKRYGDTPEDIDSFLEDCISYFEMLKTCNEDKEPEKMLYPSVETLCLHLGISRTSLFRYAQRSEAWSEAVDVARNAIAAARVELATHFKIPPLIHLFDLCNNHPHYHNTSEFRLNTEQTPREETPKIDTHQLTALIEDTATTPQLPE